MQFLGDDLKNSRESEGDGRRVDYRISRQGASVAGETSRSKPATASEPENRNSILHLDDPLELLTASCLPKWLMMWRPFWVGGNVVGPTRTELALERNCAQRIVGQPKSINIPANVHDVRYSLAQLAS